MSVFRVMAYICRVTLANTGGFLCIIVLNDEHLNMMVVKQSVVLQQHARSYGAVMCHGTQILRLHNG